MRITQILFSHLRPVETQNFASQGQQIVMSNAWRRKILDKFGGTSTIDASIMVFSLHKFCVSTDQNIEHQHFLCNSSNWRNLH